VRRLRDLHTNGNAETDGRSGRRHFGYAHAGPLNADEAVLLSEVPRVTRGLLARIPRLDDVAAIVDHALRAQPAKTAASVRIAENAAILMMALEYDALVSRVANTLTRRDGRYTSR